jgi:hypothetical protein
MDTRYPVVVQDRDTELTKSFDLETEGAEIVRTWFPAANANAMPNNECGQNRWGIWLGRSSRGVF